MGNKIGTSHGTVRNKNGKVYAVRNKNGKVFAVRNKNGKVVKSLLVVCNETAVSAVGLGEDKGQKAENKYKYII